MENKTKVYGLGIASFVLSILSVISICYIVFSVIFGVLALMLGIMSLIIEKKNGMGIAGIIISAVSLLLTLVLYIVLGVMDVNLLYVPEYYKDFV